MSWMLANQISHWYRDKTLYLLLPRTLRNPPVQDTIDSPDTTCRSGSNAGRPGSHTPPGIFMPALGQCASCIPLSVTAY